MTVTIVVGKRHALAGLFLFVLGALIGIAVIAPATSHAVTKYTRSASCAGLDFYPAMSSTDYDNAGTLRVWRMAVGGYMSDGVFRCDPGLPNGAVVKKVQFTALLNDGNGVGDCSLRRSGLTAATAATGQDLGRVSFHTPGQTTTGAVRLTDSSIANATIDNANYGYWLECLLLSPAGWGGPAVSGLYGANVIYTITAAKG